MELPAHLRPAPSSAVERLWQLRPAGPGRYDGRCREGGLKRAFGGQMVAQALAAIGAELGDDWYPHSLHAYYVRPGRAADAIEYRTERISDDDPAARLCQVTASQSDRPILTMQTAFRPLDHDVRATMLAPTPPGASDPAGWMSDDPDDVLWLEQLFRRMPFDLRFAGRPAQLAGRSGEVADGQRFWLRTREPLPDRALDHACAIGYISDLFLVSTGLARHGRSNRHPGVQSASIDHAVWFHRFARADDWLRYEQRSLTAAQGRGLCEGRILDGRDRLVATVRQEVLMRLSD